MDSADDWSYSLPLQGQIVKIEGLTGPLKLDDAEKEVDGPSQNGKVGRVECGNANFCKVSLWSAMDMLVLTVPRESLVAWRPEDGGFDVYAPRDEDSLPTVSFDMLTALSHKGYCVVQMPESSDMLQTLGQELRWYKSDFVCLPSEAEEEYLGHEPKSKVVPLTGSASSELEESEGTSIGHYMKCISQMSSLVMPHAAESLNFSPAPKVGSFMIRQNFAGRSEMASLQRGSFTAEEKQEGAVGDLLDFIQRRRLCCMYFVSCEGGHIELTPCESGSGMEKVSLPSLAGKLLIFRQDLLHSACKDLGEHVIVQGWVLTEQRSLILNELMGAEDQIMRITGATNTFYNQPMSRGDDIHFMSLACKSGGGVFNGASKCNMYYMQTDTQIKIPLQRWDHDIYLAVVDNGWGLCQHSGLVLDHMMFAYDNQLFGVTDEEAFAFTPTLYMQSECAMEALVHGGWTKETMRGSKIDLYVADAAKEGEFLLGQTAGSQANEKWYSHYIPGQLVAYLLGLQGRLQHIDTACSASNVATNLAYQNMRVSRDASLFYAPRQRQSYGQPRAWEHLLQRRGRLYRLERGAHAWKSWAKHDIRQ